MVHSMVRIYCGRYLCEDGNGAVGLFGYLGSDGTIWNVGVVKSYIHGDEEAIMVVLQGAMTAKFTLVIIQELLIMEVLLEES